MARTIVVLANPAASEQAPDTRLDTGWRTFFRSWTFAAILAAACVLGVFAIVNAHPFGSASVSQRVSDALGHPASCAKVGVSALNGQNLTIYKCTVGDGAKTASPCFTESGGELRQISGGSRKLGC
jgi:hypothetical protein